MRSGAGRRLVARSALGRLDDPSRLVHRLRRSSELLQSLCRIHKSLRQRILLAVAVCRDSPPTAFEPERVAPHLTRAGQAMLGAGCAAT